MFSIRILKISDGKAGHTKAAEGVIKCLSNAFPNNEIIIDTLQVKLRLKFFMRILKLFLKFPTLFKTTLSTNNFLSIFYKLKEKFNSTHKYNYIISGGGDTSFANIYLAKKYTIKNIYVSRLRNIDPTYFYLIVTNYEEENFTNSILVDLAPLDVPIINTQKLALFVDKLPSHDKDIYSLILGGNGAGYAYKRSDFKAIINGFLVLLEKNDAYGFLSTSRRTLGENDRYIKYFIEQHSLKNRILYSIYFNEAPEFLLDCYMHLSKVLFVTEDSGAMLTEAILSQKPTFSIRPEQIKSQKNYESFLKNISKYISKSITANEIRELKLSKIEKNNIESPSEILTNKLITYLKKHN